MALAGNVALVTGASRGIGAAVARALAAQGVAVAVNYFASEGAAHTLVAEIAAAGGRAMAVKADARDRAQLDAMAATVQAEFGPIGILVLNASIGFPMTSFQDGLPGQAHGRDGRGLPRVSGRPAPDAGAP